jgi:hypothetical protein
VHWNLADKKENIMPKVQVTNARGLVQSTGSGPADIRSGLGLGVQTVDAAGSDQAGAGAISAAAGGLVLVTGANGTKGVRLPALSSVPTGTVFLVMNTLAGGLKVYPAVGDKVLPAGDNASITIAGTAMLICVAADGEKWVGAEPAVVSA